MRTDFFNFDENEEDEANLRKTGLLLRTPALGTRSSLLAPFGGAAITICLLGDNAGESSLDITTFCGLWRLLIILMSLVPLL